MTNPASYTAFDGTRRFSQGPLGEVVLKIKRRLGKGEQTSLVIFSDATGKVIDFNFQGTEKDVLKRLEIFVAEEEPSGGATGPGRPRLGVISREISLLPRHWEWLSAQPGGASATLRKLVEAARKSSEGVHPRKQAQERTHLFLTAVAGDFPGYEEALRALYRGDRKLFLAQIGEWPADIRVHVLELASPLFAKSR